MLPVRPRPERRTENHRQRALGQQHQGPCRNSAVHPAGERPLRHHCSVRLPIPARPELLRVQPDVGGVRGPRRIYRVPACSPRGSNTQDPALFSGNIQVGSEEDIYRGTVGRSFDGWPKMHSRRDQHQVRRGNLEDRELNRDNADALDALVPSPADRQSIDQRLPEEDASTEMGHFDDTDADRRGSFH